MSRARIVGLCTAGACAISAIASGSAMALPEVGRCVAQPGTGKYRNSNCTEKARALASEKSFEWSRGAGTGGRSFTTQGGEATLEGAKGTKLACKSESSSGEYREVNGAIKEVTNVTIEFHECMIPLVDVGCTNAGAAEHSFRTNPLKGRLGYISGKGTKTPVVGQELTPMVKKGKVAVCEVESFAEKLEIGEAEGKGGDRIISTINEVDVMSTTSRQRFAAGETGVQAPDSFEGLFKIANLEWRVGAEPFERMTWSFETEQTNAQPLEIKA
jgi:hypothetical protein